MAVTTLATGSTLAPYSGTFGRREAAHLMRRTTYGTTKARIQEAEALGLAGALDRLLTPGVTLPAPINYDFEDDPNVPIGATWVTAPYVEGVDVQGYRARSLRQYQYDSYTADEISLSGRMAFFWHNHFGITENGDARPIYRYYALLRASATGNFRQLIEDVTVSEVMLRFLNGNESLIGNPNENYARELLELFTLGKGEHVGSGDYTTYTEDDIRAIANALTGWQVWYYGSREADNQPASVFRVNRHDPAPRQLSHRFGDRLLTVVGEEAYKEVVDAVFAHPLAAHYLCRKLYRFFVYYDIDADVEANVIAPLAQALVDADFEVAPVLRLLLGSQHFFDITQRGALVKCPLQFTSDLMLGFGFPRPTDSLYQNNWLTRAQLWHMERQQMLLRQPPSVAGWKAYYQAPQYNRSWINASTLGTRTDFANSVVGNGFTHQMRNHRLDLLRYIEDFDNPTDPNALVAEFAERLISEPLDPVQLASLKELLIPGLPDFEWTVEYGDHLAHPDDEDLANAVRAKLQAMVRALVTSPEFHLF